MLFKNPPNKLTLDEITDWLLALRQHHQNPISNFCVSVVFRVEFNHHDYYFAGVNVEDPFLRLSSHAEEGAIAAMVTALGSSAEIREGWVMGAPNFLKPGDTHPLANNKISCCGKCRQQIAGFAGPEAIIHALSLNGEHEEATMGELLPNCFSFKNFLPEDLQPSKLLGQYLTDDQIIQKLFRKNKDLTHDEIYEWLKQLESVNHATKTELSVVIRLSNQAYVAGVTVEEAAFISISPIQSALAIASTQFKDFTVEQVWVLSNIPTLTLSELGLLTKFSKYPTILVNSIVSSIKPLIHSDLFPKKSAAADEVITERERLRFEFFNP